jgi:hypothetical protein
MAGEIRLQGRRAVITVDTVQVKCGGPGEFDCEFEVEKDLSGKPNTASLKIWGLNEDHRTALSAKAKTAKPRVRIEAGYVEGVSRIFEGDVRHLWHEREGAEVVTHCETGDGERFVSSSRIFRAWAPGTPVATVLRDVAKALGAGDGNLATAVLGATLEGWGPVYTQGAAVAGKTVNVLNRITRSAGLEWSIQDGTLQILGKGQSLAGAAVLLNAGSGLVGSPSIDHTGKNAGQVLVKMLMIPDVFPGRKLKIDAIDLKGDYRAEKCKYSGATAGNEWYISVEARAL